MQNYIYESADTNFASYLFYLGFKGEPKTIETVNKRVKVIFQFEGESKRQFIDIFNNYRFEEVKLNLAQFIKYKDETFKAVRDALDDYYQRTKPNIKEPISLGKETI